MYILLVGQYAVDDGAEIKEFIHLLHELNAPVPPLGEHARHLRDAKVQSSLQGLFRAYFKSLIEVLLLLKRKDYSELFPLQDLMGLLLEMTNPRIWTRLGERFTF